MTQVRPVTLQRHSEIALERVLVLICCLNMEILELRNATKMRAVNATALKLPMENVSTTKLMNSISIVTMVRLITFTKYVFPIVAESI